ncbi:MAG TPA: protease modulator HflC [Caulobacteraceae bacterium]|nr:protease modulator HflC [Caulobacteraceae bacterium]
MNRVNWLAPAIIAAALLIVAANTFYIVSQTEQAIVLRFGEPIRTVNATADDSPGLKVKAPFFEKVLKFDKRILKFEPQEAEVTARDQNRLIVDAFVRYRISEPLQFYRGLRTVETAQDRLGSMVNSALREQLGSVTIDEIINQRRAELMTRTRDEVAKRAKASHFGIQVIDLRIRRADYPQANTEAVYKRMATARQQQAAQYRAEGKQQAQQIVGEANKEGERIRGEADAERARIFAQSFGQDPGFAVFYRSMSAYEASFGPDTTMVLSPDSEFFKYFRAGPSAGGK